MHDSVFSYSAFGLSQGCYLGQGFEKRSIVVPETWENIHKRGDAFGGLLAGLALDAANEECAINNPDNLSGLAASENVVIEELCFYAPVKVKSEVFVYSQRQDGKTLIEIYDGDNSEANLLLEAKFRGPVVLSSERLHEYCARLCVADALCAVRTGGRVVTSFIRDLSLMPGTISFHQPLFNPNYVQEEVFRLFREAQTTAAYRMGFPSFSGNNNRDIHVPVAVYGPSAERLMMGEFVYRNLSRLKVPAYAVHEK